MLPCRDTSANMNPFSFFFFSPVDKSGRVIVWLEQLINEPLSSPPHYPFRSVFSCLVPLASIMFEADLWSPLVTPLLPAKTPSSTVSASPVDKSAWRVPFHINAVLVSDQSCMFVLEDWNVSLLLWCPDRPFRGTIFGWGGLNQFSWVRLWEGCRKSGSWLLWIWDWNDWGGFVQKVMNYNW